jgi:hypothetical protein
MHAIQQYSSFPPAPSFVAPQRNNVVRLPTTTKARYADAVDAEVVEVVPAVIDTSSIYLTRAQAAIRLYTSIYNYNPRPPSNLNVSI